MEIRCEVKPNHRQTLVPNQPHITSAGGDSIAHLLKPRRLFLQAFSERVDLLLLLGDGGLLSHGQPRLFLTFLCSFGNSLSNIALTAS